MKLNESKKNNNLNLNMISKFTQIYLSRKDEILKFHKILTLLMLFLLKTETKSKLINVLFQKFDNPLNPVLQK